MHLSVYRCQTWPTIIVCSLLTLFYRCQPMAGNTNQGVHTFDVAYAHVAGDINKWHAASAKACTHKRGMCVSCKRRQLMAYDISQGLHSWTWHMHISKATLTNGMQHQQRHACIICSMCTSAWRYQSWSMRIGQENSVVACTDCPSNIGQRKATAKAYTHQPWRVPID